MNLLTPPEPKEIKSWMKSIKETQLTDPSIDWDSLVVWYGNKLPKYLWDAWKTELKPMGFTWQKFMRLLRYRTDVGVMWYKGFLRWEEYVKKVVELVDGPIGQGLAKQGR
jgi:hypothetical protein